MEGIPRHFALLGGWWEVITPEKHLFRVLVVDGRIAVAPGIGHVGENFAAQRDVWTQWGWTVRVLTLRPSE